ncbi:MAG: glycosyltransferase family 2 protein [Hyphomicrobiales bacterium]|nr:glycosyltransferase family 2 protein [Hyphomicrobiales bacterium]
MEQPLYNRFPAVWAVMVTHHPPETVTRSIEILLPQVVGLVVVDNASDTTEKERLKYLERQSGGAVHLMENPANEGLARAQNQGIHYALTAGAEWVLLMDDDSMPAEDMVAQLLSVLTEDSVPETIALLSPSVHEVSTGQVAKYVQRGWFGFRRVAFGEKNTLEVLAVIASGSLIRAAALRDVGGMVDDFFIDYIDTEFSLRLIGEGWRVVAVRGAVLQHRLGNKTMHRLGSLRLTATNHSPVRRFTIYRNRVRVWRRYWWEAGAYVWYDILAAGYDLMRILLVERQKWQKLTAALRGIGAGLRAPRPVPGPFY